MSASATPLGALTPGVVFQHTAGVFASVLPASVGQTLLSTGLNTYAFNNYAGPSSNSGVLQIVSANPPAINITPVVTGGAPPYNAAAEIASVTITPLSATSTFITNFSTTCTMTPGVATGIILGIDGYLNAAGAIIVSNQVNDGSGVAQYTAQCGGCSLVFSTGSQVGFSVNYCCFANFSTSTSTVSATNDQYNIIEINSASLVPTIPVFVSTSATPVLAVLIPSTTANQTSQVTGYVVANDAANVQSNLIQYIFVMQQGASLAVAPTIAQGTAIVQSVTGTSFLNFIPVVGGVEISFLGIAGTTFVCQQSNIVSL
jgi:hypothetical protein